MTAPQKNRTLNLAVLLLATRPKFLTASAAPVIVGSALAYATTGNLRIGLFILALLAIMALHAGANVANDYFDHISGNDWLNTNPTPFSGGRRFIQNGTLSPKATLLLALFALTLGSAIGILIVILTESLFILALGLIGLLGGFFYTAPPLKLGYRTLGEIAIAFLFGLMPFYAAWYLQTETITILPLAPAAIVSILIFLIILINEFPDAAADASANKKTLVVVFGVPAAIWIYRTALLAAYCIAAAMLLSKPLYLAGLCYLLTFPLAIVALRLANKTELTTRGRFRANAAAVLLHILGSLTLTAAFIISALSRYR